MKFTIFDNPHASLYVYQRNSKLYRIIQKFNAESLIFIIIILILIIEALESWCTVEKQIIIIYNFAQIQLKKFLVSVVDALYGFLVIMSLSEKIIIEFSVSDRSN